MDKNYPCWLYHELVFQHPWMLMYNIIDTMVTVVDNTEDNNHTVQTKAAVYATVTSTLCT